METQHLYIIVCVYMKDMDMSVDLCNIWRAVPFLYILTLIHTHAFTCLTIPLFRHNDVAL